MEGGHHAPSTEQHRNATRASGVLGVDIAALDHLAGRGAAQSDGLASISGMQCHIGICHDELQNCHPDAPLLNATTGVATHEVRMCDHRRLPFGHR